MMGTLAVEQPDERAFTYEVQKLCKDTPFVYADWKRHAQHWIELKTSNAV